jgi:glycosyltransferase involved in cell wall biosynthesis
LQKNPELLIESFAKFHELSNSKSKLHLVGDGELISSLKQLAQDLKITNHCIFHGWLDNKNTFDLMKKCKTLVSTSIIEGMALVRFEALANGCCIVTTNTGGTRQYLLPGAKNGIFVTKSDSLEIAKEMHSSLNDKYWSQELVQNRISISLEFSAPKIAAKLIEVN